MDASSNPTADTAAILIVKLIMDLDELILGLRSGIPRTKPWQRQLHALLGQADQQMQVLRMTEVMEKPDVEIVEATIQLASTCRRISLAIQGSRADSLARTGAQAVGQIGNALSRAMQTESKANLAVDAAS